MEEVSDDSGEEKWGKRVSWAECRGPYKTTLDTLVHHWVEGTISDGEFALELWKIHNQCRDAVDDVDCENSGRWVRRTSIDLTDVEDQIVEFADALTFAARGPKSQSRDADSRIEALEYTRMHAKITTQFRSR